MTPQTKPHLSFRQRRVVPSGERIRVVDLTAVEAGSGSPDDKAAGPATAGQPDTVTHSAAAAGAMVSEAVSEAADRLHRGYTSPTAPASSQRLAAVSLWALLLVVGGVVVGLRTLVSQLGGSGTGLTAWMPTLTAIGGTIGLGTTIAAFLTIGARRTPWVLLGGASAILVVLLVLGAIAA
jgi:hypothetical protein